MPYAITQRPDGRTGFQALSEGAPAIEFEVARVDDQPPVPFVWDGGEVRALTPQETAELEQAQARERAFDPSALFEWSVKTILAWMPFRWDPEHGAPVSEMALPPPAVLTDSASGAGLFSFFANQTGTFANPVEAGLCAFATHATNNGALPALVDQSDNGWRATRIPLGEQFLDIETIGKHAFVMESFAFYKRDDASRPFKTFDVLEQVSVDDVLTWQFLARVSSTDGAAPGRLEWTSPIIVPGVEFRNKYRLVPVEDWSGSTDEGDGRFSFAELEVFGKYRGPFA